MDALQNGIYPLIALTLVLGMKHGMDADHLATIDGLTRFNALAGRHRLARLCGFLFSLGHGLVVCMVAMATGFLFRQGAVPQWMDDVGVWVSAGFLLLLGTVNLYAVFSTPAHEIVRMVGIKGRLLGRLVHAGHPLLITLVGALFALSFDTLSQAALFSASAAQFGGMPQVLLLALSFMLGMMLTDAANGLWISHLLQRADATARAASRIMGISVALLSLAVAALGISHRFFPQAAAWQDGRELLIGCALTLVVGLCFLVARYSPQRTPVSA